MCELPGRAQILIKFIDQMNEFVGRIVSVVAVMLGGYALRHQAHVRVDLITETLAPTLRRWVEAAGYVIFFFPFAWIFTTRSYEFAMRSYAQGETTYGSVQLPVYPLKMAMALAAGLLLLQGVAEFLKLVLNRQELPRDA